MSISYKTLLYSFLLSFIAMSFVSLAYAGDNIGFAKKSNIETHENGWTSSELAFPGGLVLFRSSYLNSKQGYAISFDRTTPECPVEYMSINIHTEQFKIEKIVKSDPLNLEMILDGKKYIGKYTFNMDPAYPIAYLRIVDWDETPENLSDEIFAGKMLELHFIEQLEISFKLPVIKVLLGGYSDATLRTFNMCQERDASDPFKDGETFI